MILQNSFLNLIQMLSYIVNIYIYVQTAITNLYYKITQSPKENIDFLDSSIYAIDRSGGGNFSWRGKYTNGVYDDKGMTIKFHSGVQFLKEKSKSADLDFSDILVEVNDSKVVERVSNWKNPEIFLFNLTFASWNMSGWHAYLNPSATQVEKTNSTDIEPGSGLLVRGLDFWAKEFIWFESREIVMNIFDEIEFIYNFKTTLNQLNPLNVESECKSECTKSDDNRYRHDEWYEPLDITPDRMRNVIWSKHSSNIMSSIEKTPYSDVCNISIREVLDSVFTTSDFATLKRRSKL
jgi:hypothetical protein